MRVTAKITHLPQPDTYESITCRESLAKTEIGATVAKIWLFLNEDAFRYLRLCGELNKIANCVMVESKRVASCYPSLMMSARTRLSMC